MHFDLSGYLARIDHGAEPPSAKALAALQAAQLRAIPFENFAPLMGHVPDLSEHAIWRKLVRDGRGGYCLELNRLFGQALTALGYRHRPVLGRVRMGAEQGGSRAHLAHIVSIEGQDWLADTGFGGPGPEHPIAIADGAAQKDPLGAYRIRADHANGESVLERQIPGGWFALYGFDRVPVTEPDVIAANFVCSRWDQSPFPNHLMLSRVRDDGRVNMFDLRLTTPGGERTVCSLDEFSAVLQTEFGLTGVGLEINAVWARLSATSANARQTG